MLHEITDIIRKHKSNPEKLFDEFFGFYENILFSQPSMNEGLAAFSSPFKELIAAHQAWGMIGSDGFDNYLYQVDECFDGEVRKGLMLIGKDSSFNALEEARAIFKEHNEVPETIEERLWHAFYGPIEGFEKLAGEYLINHCG